MQMPSNHLGHWMEGEELTRRLSAFINAALSFERDRSYLFLHSAAQGMSRLQESTPGLKHAKD
jgi:hypothetical protein